MGQGDLEQGVFDRPEPVVHPVLSGPGPGPDEAKFEVPDETDQPEFLPGWPEEWIKDEPGWVDAEWVMKEDEVAIDLGAIISGAIDIAQGQMVGGGAASGMGYVPMGSPVPSNFPVPAGGQKIQIDPKTGKVTLCRRRRRRRLLTPTDLNDLAALKTIVGGGQAINFAVMKAVRR